MSVSVSLLRLNYDNYYCRWERASSVQWVVQSSCDCIMYRRSVHLVIWMDGMGPRSWDFLLADVRR